MKRRLVSFAILGGLGLAVGFVSFIWPRHARDPLLRLKVVRQIVEKGKPVVFFRVEGGGRRRVIITEVQQIVGERWQAPSWASKGPPLAGPLNGRNEFGVLCPTNPFVWKDTTWKLRASLVVEQEEQLPLKAIRVLRMVWRSYRARGLPVRSAFDMSRALWSAFYIGGQQPIESVPITNTVPIW